MSVIVEPSVDVDTAVDRLDALRPGLAGCVVDLLDALHDRADELGPARPDLLVRLAGDLDGRWPSAAEADRPLVVLDALRSLLLRQVEGP